MCLADLLLDCAKSLVNHFLLAVGCLVVMEAVKINSSD